MHYYTREIGFETVGLWKLKLQTKLNEIMPYYNKLYETELLKYNPLYDVDMTTTNVGQKTGESVNINQTDETRENFDLTFTQLQEGSVLRAYILTDLETMKSMAMPQEN